MRKKTEDLKVRILEGAITLFIEKGIDKVTTRELAEQLGLSRSHIYHYYSNWQSLCVAALSKFMESELTEFNNRTVGLKPYQKLTYLAENYLPVEQDVIWQLYASLWRMAANNAAYAELAEFNNNQWMVMVSNIIQDGINQGVFRPVNAEQVARQLGAMLNGYAEILIIDPSIEKYEQANEDINKFIRLAL